MLLLSLRLRRRTMGLALCAGLVGFVVGLAMTPSEVEAHGNGGAETNVVDDKARTKEYTLKAAFVFNFLKYTTWPKGTFDEKDDPIVLGVVGKDSYGDILEKVLGKKKVGDRGVVVKRFDKVTEVEDLHALIVGTLSSKDRTKLYAQLASSAVLVVGDEKGMASEDACTASFFLEKGKVRFEVSTKAIKRTGLTMSSQLLKLADVVEKRK